MNLYSDFAQEFSNTRQGPWKGWSTMVQKLGIEKKRIWVLDVGCGNGRFLKFLIDRSMLPEKYIGLDNSKELLEIAQNSFKSQKFAQFLNVDLNKPDWLQKLKTFQQTSSPKKLNPVPGQFTYEPALPIEPGTFNLITAFGLMHHIETFEARKQILKYSIDVLSKIGFLVVTYWQFGALARYNDKIVKRNPKNSKDRFAENDFTLSFGTSGANRFCHFTSNQEIEELEKGLNLRVVASFHADGREDNENFYRIYAKK